VVAVACRTGDAWQVGFTLSTPLRSGSFAPAASLDALDAYLTAIEATVPMSPGDEARALRF
jgi:hypothetical protein